MRWKVNCECERYMREWRELCDSAMLHNAAYQTRKRNHPSRVTFARPALDQQREEARIARMKGKLDLTYRLCLASPDNEYGDPADPRLFDEASKRKITQWRCQEAVRRKAKAQAVLRTNGGRQNGGTTARAPARVTEFTSVQQVMPQDTGIATSHVEATLSDKGYRRIGETPVTAPARVNGFALGQQATPQPMRRAASHAEANSSNHGDRWIVETPVRAPIWVDGFSFAQQVTPQEMGRAASHTEAALSNHGGRRIEETTVRTPATVTGFASAAQQVIPHRVGTAASHVDHQEGSPDLGSNASGVRAPELDRSPEPERYSQRPSPQPVRRSTTLMSFEYHSERPLQANLAPENVHGHTRVGGRSSSFNARPSSALSASRSRFDEEFAVVQHSSREAVGTSDSGPLHTDPSDRLTCNQELIRLLGGSVIKEILDAGDYNPLVDVRS